MKTSDIELIEVFSGTSWEVGIVKSKLESEGIEVFLKDEIMGTLNPWWVSAGGAGALKVVISSADLERAKVILDSIKF